MRPWRLAATNSQEEGNSNISRCAMKVDLPGVEEVMGVDAHHSLEQECARDQIREDWMTLCIGPNDLRFG